MPKKKPEIAFYWCAGCGGCEEAVVDLAEDILSVINLFDIVFWPVALDFKKSDLEAKADGEIFASFINGSIRTTEHVEVVRLLRRKSKKVVAFGACAYLGGVPGLANGNTLKEILETIYLNAPTVENPEKVIPGPNGTPSEQGSGLPALLKQALPLSAVIPVDYYIPGCAPTPKIVKEAITLLLSAELPPPGSVLAPSLALCHECPLNETKPEVLKIEHFRRVHTSTLDPDKCLLAQGFLCLGPATRGGCEALCIKGGMPCTGCFGPLDNVLDGGAKALSAMASLLGAEEPEAILEALKDIPDPLGAFYRYSLPSSILLPTKEKSP